MIKIIQSFWSKPFFEKTRSSHANKLMLMSWALSSLQLRKYYPDVELITDNRGKELLIDLLKLPYKTTHVCLDDLNQYDADLWAIGKISAYSKQEQPFLHVDGDIFVSEPFHEGVNTSDLIALHDEGSLSAQYNYGQRMKHVNTLPYVPPVLQKLNDFSAINAGLLGGRNISFIQKFCKEAFKFVDTNASQLEKTKIDGINMVYEQLLFSCLAKRDSNPVSFYVPEETADLYSLPDWPVKSKLIHARTDKRAASPLMDELICISLYKSHPAYYWEILRTLNLLAL